NDAIRARRSTLYVDHRFSTDTRPLARPPQSIRPLANNAARSWKLRTARDNESDRRSKRANGEAGATGCGTGTGAGTGAAAGGGTAAGGAVAAVGAGAVTGRRRGAGGVGFRAVTRATSCFARSSSPVQGGGTPGLRSTTYQYPPAPAPASNNRIATRRSQGPRRFRRRGLGAGFFSSSSSRSRSRRRGRRRDRWWRNGTHRFRRHRPGKVAGFLHRGRCGRGRWRWWWRSRRLRLRRLVRNKDRRRRPRLGGALGWWRRRSRHRRRRRLVVRAGLDDGDVIGARPHDPEAAITRRLSLFLLRRRRRLGFDFLRLFCLGWRRRLRCRDFGPRPRQRRTVRLVIPPRNEGALLPIRLDRVGLQQLVERQRRLMPVVTL